MGWKDWSYWLKGGIIGLILGVLYFLANLVFSLGCMGWYNGIETSSICPLVDSIFKFGLLRIIFFPFALFTDEYLILLLNSAILFAVIGWIYGKIKNRV